MTIVPLVIVWLLTGLWHGTGLDYILWGGILGSNYYTINGSNAGNKAI